MARDMNGSDLSELEQEFELEMDDLEMEEDQESDEEFGNSGDYEADLQEEFEAADEEGGDYADRFYELAQRGYESESEADEHINGLLGEMEREYFFGGFKKFLKGKAKGLLKKGLKYAAGKVPAFKAIQGLTQLARGDLKGMLASLAKAGLATAVPGGAAVLPALSALGFEATEDQDVNREAWDNYVGVCREAYEHLAQNLNENADEPLEASRLATNAFQTAVRRAHARPAHARRMRRGGVAVHSRRGRRVVYLGPGEYIVVKRR